MLTEEVAWHDRRRARIRKKHPQVRELYGYDRRTQIAMIGLVGGHFAVAGLLTQAPVAMWLGATIVVGPTLAHALGVLIHETSHNLVAKGTRANKAWGLFLNLPLGAPAAMEFRTQHLLHHRFLGSIDPVDGKDTQAPGLAEDAWVGGSPVRKLLSFTAGRFYWKGRPANGVAFDGWMKANWLTSFGAIALVASSWGPAPALYLLCSSLLAFGPHPFGARRLSEHLPVRDAQPTNSYYGALNAVSFNVGYHVEHHDFPNIPWTRMKRLRALAPGEYEDLFAFRSWTRLILSYFTDSRYRVRHYIGLGQALGDEVVCEGGAAELRDAQSEEVGETPDAIPNQKVGSGFFVRSKAAEQRDRRGAA